VVRPVWIFVEGGGDSHALKTECRKAFSKLAAGAGLVGKMPAFIPCGSRMAAFDQFKHALTRGESSALLLVDSESPVTHLSPWDHVKGRTGDGWERPASASDEDLHLMIECMEAWLLADPDAIRKFFGQGFNDKPLKQRPVESIPKAEVYRTLEHATRDCKTKAAYGKGEHSFKLLAAVDAKKLRAASPGAERFFAELERRANER